MGADCKHQRGLAGIRYILSYTLPVSHQHSIILDIYLYVVGGRRDMAVLSRRTEWVRDED